MKKGIKKDSGKYLTNVNIIKNAFGLKGDRQMSEEESKTFIKSYEEKMMILATDKNKLKEIQKAIHVRKGKDNAGIN